MKKSIMAAAIGAMALAAALPMGAAEAGKGKKFKFKWHHGHHFTHHHIGHGCFWLKKRYYKTGKKYWLYRYYDCKFYY